MCPPDVEHINSALEHNMLLEELLFWGIKLEFPAPLVTFLLSLLPNSTYKVPHTSQPLTIAPMPKHIKST